MISRIVVVLPAPFGPITPYNGAGGDREIEIVHGDRRSERLPNAEEPQGGFASSAIDLAHDPPRRRSERTCIHPVQADVCSPAK